MKELVVILICVFCANAMADPNDWWVWETDPDIIWETSTFTFIEWEPPGPYIVDPNNLPWDITCKTEDVETTIEMKADGNLYLSGSWQDFIICLYEAMALDGRSFQGKIIQGGTDAELIPPN
ncbi:hypothetical protein LCGC14_0358760 [marine sediment metagenome]|uniref:Uncharacterized protein n=1 Tax=marine sediment metagenome TaxID=412755 RepID=A0A0F9VVX2_9ZZZZ